MEQRDLVDIISRVHEELRRKRRENVDRWDLAWKEHTQNEIVIQALIYYYEVLKHFIIDKYDSTGFMYVFLTKITQYACLGVC